MDIDRRLMYIKAIFRYKQMTGQEKVPDFVAVTVYHVHRDIWQVSKS